MLKLGAFELSKWVSNYPELLKIDNRDRVPVIIRDNAVTSYIQACNGISARIRSNFSANLRQKPTLYQNRSYFPRSKLFDSLDLLGPIIVIAKLICGNGLSNGTSPFLRPHSLDCFQNTDDLSQLRIRCVKLNAHQSKCTDFATPASARSELAYTFASSSVSTIIFELLCSKSRVAPLKTVLLSQLELLAALLLARLINKVRESLEFSKCPTYL